MRPSEKLKIYREQIKSIVLSHRATDVKVFGSVIHDTDTELSDLDILIEPTNETSMMDIGAIRYELKKLLGINVDVLTPNALPDSFREKVLKEAVPI